MKHLKDYITESKFSPEKAKTALEIENAMNNGDFIVTNDVEFQCPKLTDLDLEDLEEAIRQYWDDSGISWLKLERSGNTFKITSTKSKK